MKKSKKILSLFLAVLMLCGVLTGFSVTVSADETTAETGTGTGTGTAEEDKQINYLTDVYETPEAKLATMKRKLKKGDYELYSDETSGEVAVRNVTTGQILFTNPYDIGASNATDSIKYQLLSQIIIKYTDNGKEREFNSYEYASMRDQITVKNIKNGIRVEYIIGREEARHLVPRVIENTRFREKLLGPMLEYYGLDKNLDISSEGGMTETEYAATVPFALRQLIAYYGGRDGMKSIARQKTDSLKEKLIQTYPVLKKKPDMEFWVFDGTASSTQIEKQENMIRTAAPDYSYEEMDYDHQLTEYESTETNPPVFKMALEYTLGEDGFTVRLPVNGLSFNETLYQLTSISVLPYMGCGNNTYDGYVFYPDGSGTLFAMQDMPNTTTSVSSKVYGVDYAYHKLTGTYQQTVRYPAFGIVEDTRYYDCLEYDDELGQQTVTRISGVVYDAITKAQKEGKSTPAGMSSFATLIGKATEIQEVVSKRGFTAVIEEGDALTNVMYYHAGVLSEYDTVMMNFNPRPQDSYNLADSISVGTNTEWTVITDRKYTGNFKVHYILLTDSTVAKEKGLENGKWYDTTWLGMAFAYRDYLVGKGLLSELPAADTSGDIPLYIESFGAVQTTEKIASIPVTVKRAMTSAADVITMYEDLAKQGITNVNFKLTGFANGGMYAKMPYNLKWEKAVSKDTSMQELLDYAAKLENGNLGIFPDFDFSYVNETGMFDGLSLRKHVVKTIDDRYSSKREYSPTMQKYVGYYQLAISPAYLSHFYEKFMKKYHKLDNVTGISVGTLGTALNSDFDDDEPYNREDARTFVKRALEYIAGSGDQALDVMVDGGNVYTWKYVRHILNAPLDSSRYIRSSYSVPFLGVVLHGYMNFAGTPLNMEGDVEYAKLKAIENGASPYFILSYKNTEILKDYYQLSHYYSIRYDIWQEDVVELYNELNSVLKDVQSKPIVAHSFLSGMRVPDADELESDMNEEFNKVLDYQNNQAEYDRKQQNQAISDARKTISTVEDMAVAFVKTCISSYSGISGSAYMYVTGDRSLEMRLMNFVEADNAHKAVKAQYDAAVAAGKSDEELKTIATTLAAAESTRKSTLAQLRTYVRNISRAIKSLETEHETLQKLLADAEAGKLLIESTSGVHESIKQEINERLATTEALMKQQLGIQFKDSVDKAEMDTFFRAHIALLMCSAYGENLRSQPGIVGKAENLYEMVVSGSFGLLNTDVEKTILRYLDANRNLTDAELEAKYGLSDGKTSVAGLVLYARELFGTQFRFDPTLSDEKGADGLSEVDKHILGYFTSMLYTAVTGLADDNVLPKLNFIMTRKLDNGKEGSNQTNVSNTTKKIGTAIDTILNPRLKGVTDGNYKLTAADKEMLDKAVEAAVKVVESAINDSDTTKRVEYATPDTLQADLRAYIESYYYRAALKLVAPDGMVESLAIRTVTYKTASSLATLAASRLTVLEQAGSYKQTLANFKGDAVTAAKLAVILSEIQGVYGDVSSELEKAMLKAYAAAAVKSLGEVSITFKTNSKNINAALLTEYTEKIAAAGEAGLPALIEELAARLGTEGYVLKDEEADKNALASDFIYYAYAVSLSETTVMDYYYDVQMATMDRKVRDAVRRKHDEIAAKITADTTPNQLYNMLLATLGNAEDSVAQLTKEISTGITYYIESKYSISSDVQKYYVYLLFQSFSEQLSGNEEPVLTIYVSGKPAKPSDGTYKNAIKYFKKDYLDARITDLQDKARKASPRGEIVNYALDSVLTAEEMTAWVDRIYARLVDGKFLTDEMNQTDEAKAQLRADIEAYIRYQYCEEALTKVNANTTPKFNVSEVYGDDLYTSSEQIKALLRYFVTNLSEITEKDIEEMIKTGTKTEEEEIEDPSKYLSADGRIVSVTYGSKKSDGSYENYKTFLLNYNNFAVSVRYDDVTYTIPAYGYVVVMH